MSETVNLTLTAVKEDYNISLPGFLREHPNTEIDLETKKLLRTNAQHIAWVLSNYYFNESNRGLRILAGEAVQLNKVFE